jgi:ankyrin repeat protein
MCFFFFDSQKSSKKIDHFFQFSRQKIFEKKKIDELFPLENRLLRAARQGDVNVIATMLQKGVDIECTYIDGQTALMMASDHNHVEAVQLLVDRGATIDRVDASRQSALCR